MPVAFWARYTEAMRRAAGRDFVLLGELLDGDPAVAARTWREGRFDALFDFPLAFAIADVFCRGAKPAVLAAVLTSDRRYPDPAWLVTLVDNHDLPRIASLCEGKPGGVEAALDFLLTARGVPSFSWGTEEGFLGATEPANRASMRFAPHPLKDRIAARLAARKASPALKDGAVQVLAVEAQSLAVGRPAADELAVVLVTREAGWAPELSGPWREVQGEGGAPCRAAAAGVTVCRSARAPGRFAALAQAADAQWRTGARTRTVEFVAASGAPEGARVLGSGPELGDWLPARAVKLPATVQLPEGGVFEFKAVQTSAGPPRWSAADNQFVFVQPGPGPLRVEVEWR